MGAYQYQPAESLDFSKGMTDDYVNGPVNGGQVYKNFYILNNKSLKTRPGTVIDNTAEAQLPIGSQRVQTLISYDNGDKLFAHTGNKLYYRNPNLYASLLGPTGNSAFNTANADTYLAHTEWNKHLIITPDSFDKPIKVYKDENGAYQLRTAGLPDLASEPTLAGSAGQQAYVYAFCFIYTYKVFSQTFVDFGPTTQVQAASFEQPDIVNIVISSIPALTNSSGDNYDTANIKIGIFRTTSGGTTFFKVGEVANGTATFTDSFSDSTIQNNESLYLAGGVPDNDPPPLSKFCHTVNGYTYYAYLKSGTEILPATIRQSQQFDPDSVPTIFEDEVEDEITGLSSVADIPIIGCRKHIYRIENAYDELGRNAMSHRRIHDHSGCLSHESFVQAEGQLFWWGNDGIYVTEGHRCMKVTDHLNARYKNAVATLNGKTRKIKGVYNEFTRMIHWIVSLTDKATGQEECDSIWSIDLQWGVSENCTCFIWDGVDTFKPTAIVVHNKDLYRGDRFGYVLKFDEDVFTDPKIVSGTPVNTWFEETIIWNYTSCASNFGSSFTRKFANKVLLSARNETNVSIQVTAINDDGKLTRPLTPIRWRKNFTWGDEEFVWGDSDFVWYYGGTIQVDRRFPAKGLRFDYLQLEVTNAFINIVNSDLMGLATVNGTLNTATLVDSVQGDWPQQSLDYYLYLEFDNYQRGYKVTGRTDDTLTLEDINNTLLNGTWKWQLKGYRKNEILNLVGMSVSWAPLSRSHDTFNKGESGGLT